MQTEQIKADPRTGLLSGANFKQSPHFDERPEGEEIDLIVIHSISLPPGEFGSRDIEDFFCGKLDFTRHPDYKNIAHLKVASHLLIRRSGEVVQFVPFSRRAWHAGESSFEGRTGCNDFSIGIELEGVDERPYTEIQYKQLVEIVKALMVHYPKLTAERIVGHSDVSPGRKTDPGPGFDWAYFKGKLT